MANVFRTREISLFDVFYPIVGPVQPVLASTWPQKLVTGDYTKDSEQILSSWIIADQTGGIGIKDGVEGVDDNRAWWSTCELGYKGHIVLPTLVTNAGNPGTTDPAVAIEYSNAMYVAFGADVRKLTESTGSWGSSLVTLAAVPTDGIVHKDKLYFAMGTDFERFDGATWTDGDTLGTAQACRFFIEWDSKLFTLDNDGQLDYSIDEGVTWITNALSTLPSGYFYKPFLYRNVAGDVIIYMPTKQGLYALDFVNAKWIETELALPFHTYAGRGATAWRDAAYVPSGLSIYRYSSSPAEVSMMGPDRDYGLPGDYLGNITKLLRGHNELFALIDATSTVDQDLYPAGAYGDIQIYDKVGFSVVLKWNEKAWSVIYVSGSTSTPIKTGVVATADDIYRLWFGIDGEVYYIPLQETIQNPLEATNFPFAASAEHITPWFDKNNAVIDGLASTVTAYAQNTSATEYIRIHYALDYDDNSWTLLTNTDFADGQIDSDGEAEFSLASGAGIAFKAIRFKYELARGSNTALSPDLRWVRLSYIKLLEPKWGFTVRVDCSRNYRFKTAKSLLSSLKTALETQTLGNFQFKNGNSSESHKVRIANMNGVEIGGKHSEGIYEIQLIAP